MDKRIKQAAWQRIDKSKKIFILMRFFYWQIQFHTVTGSNHYCFSESVDLAFLPGSVMGDVWEGDAISILVI